MEKNYEILLWIEEKRGEEHTEYNEDDEPQTYMRWTRKVFTKRSTAFTLRKDLERFNDGDYDFNIRVLYVTTLNGSILLDYVNHQYLHVHEYLDKTKEKEYYEKLTQINKEEQRRQDEAIDRIEKFPDYEIGGR